jgi:hypothetical protein
MFHQHDVEFFADFGKNFCLWVSKGDAVRKYGKEVAMSMWRQEQARKRAQKEKDAQKDKDTPAPTLNIIFRAAEPANRTTPAPEAARRGSQPGVSKKTKKTSEKPAAKEKKSKGGKGKGKGKGTDGNESEASAVSSHAGTGQWEEEFVAEEYDVPEDGDREEQPNAQPPAPRKARLSQYEIDMQANIERNELLLADLAVRFGGTEQLFRDKPKPRPVTRKKKVPQPPVSPSSLRRSSRQAAQSSQKVNFT